MKHLKSFNEAYKGTEVIFKNKNNPNSIIIIKKLPDGKIISIESRTNVKFPFHIGQKCNQNIYTWACNNNFLVDDKDPCPEKKILGIKAKDIPKGHELRTIYPNKFK
jgi:hypothetical protein